VTDNGNLIWLAAAYLTLLSLTVSVIDFRQLIIPNGVNAANAAGGFAFAALLDATPVLASLVGGVLGFMTMLAFRTAYRNVRGREGLGFGDVKFMLGAGLWVGWQGLAPMMLLSSLSALLFVLLRGLLSDHADLRREIPFGPFLCIGMMATWAVQAAGIAPWVVP
jgi:leader peptidase (prepilin peptidase) / N-methyltransferase